MPQSLPKIYVHVIFSTKNRKPLLDEAVRSRLCAYSAAVLRNLGCPPVEIGGVSDHMHVLCVLSRNVSPAKLVEELKKPTSRWLKTQDESLRDFQWQNGYGAFSVSPADCGNVREYIQNQEAHHRTASFEDEFRQLLREHDVEFDERYVWD
jgi:putative transposase